VRLGRGFVAPPETSLTVHADDTHPSPNVVEYAKDADPLVHEAYGLEEVAKQAHAFDHSTAADAGRVTRDAGVRRLVLTHFRSGHFVDPPSSRQRRRTRSAGQWRSRAPSTSEGALPVL